MISVVIGETIRPRHCQVKTKMSEVAPPALAALGFMKLKKHCESLDLSKDDIAQCMSKQQLLRMLGYDAPDETPPADHPRPRARLFGGNSCAGAEVESGANRLQDPSNPVWATFNFEVLEHPWARFS